MVKRLKEYLDRQGVRYEVLIHREAFTAPEVAHALHVPGKALAKVVIVKAGEPYVMAVLPSTWKVDLKGLTELFGSRQSRLATEEELQRLFEDCDLGAMPPFGNLYGLEVYVDLALAANYEVVFQAGTHSEAVKLRYQDFATLVRPTVAEFHQPPMGSSGNAA